MAKTFDLTRRFGSWKKIKGQRTIVQELEMMAVLEAFRSWQEEIGQHRVVLFTHSEAVRGSFLKSWSANEDSDRLMDVIFDIEAGFDLPVWITLLMFCQEKNTALGSAKTVEVDPWVMWCLVPE